MSDIIVKGLRKAVKDDSTEWVDANIIRLLLDRHDAQALPDGWAVTVHLPRGRYRVVEKAAGWDVYTQDARGMVGS